MLTTKTVSLEITSAKQTVAPFSNEQQLESDAQKDAAASLTERIETERLEMQQALARGDYKLYWEKCFAPLERATKEFFEMQNEFMKAMLAKMQGMQVMREIQQQAYQHLPEGWISGLSWEQAGEVLIQKYTEELLIKLQDLLNKTAEDWEDLQLPYIELIKWSKLPEEEKEKWLEIYSKPRLSRSQFRS